MFATVLRSSGPQFGSLFAMFLGSIAVAAIAGTLLAAAPSEASAAVSTKSPPAPAAQEFTCTLVIGYSQTSQWYETGGAFESVVDDDRWQLKWAGGAGVDRWSDPDNPAWGAEIVSPCASGSDAPDRIVLSISGPFGDDEAGWAGGLEGSVALIRQRFTAARRIILVPVVGGPSHRDCTLDDRRVRASWQHAHIDNAIAAVVARDSVGGLVAGPSPEVRSCEDYRDALGHLTDEAAEAIGRMLGRIVQE